MKAGGYRAVAICLLNAYANPAHEQRLAALIAEALPDVLVTCSHQVAREFREFERASTTLLSAYVQPVIDGYLHRFEGKLAGAGFAGRFTVMQSNGGRLPAEAMRQSAITALYSGPAAGVVGALRQAARSGFRDLITFDMGGTSTDVCLVQDGRPSLASESEIDGLPIRTPVLDIVSVGAGGGSIAWVDDGGMLRVGPQSAGADPGPACYGKGGTEPTTTDAHIVHRHHPSRALSWAGAWNSTPRRRRRVFAAARRTFRLGDRAGRGQRAATGRRQHRAGHPARLDRARPRRPRLCIGAVRRRRPPPRRTHRRGARHLDHRRAAQCRRDLGLWPGRLDYTKFDVVTRKMRLDEAAAAGGRPVFAEMRARLAAQFADMKLPGGLDYTHTLEMRFVGQAFEVASRSRPSVSPRWTRPISPSFSPTPITAPSCMARRSTGRRDRDPARRRHPADRRAAASSTARRWRHADRSRANLPRRGLDRLRPLCRRSPAAGQRIEGPAVIEGYTATTWVPPGWTAELDPADNMVLRRSS